jgi:hypothetical protein
MTDPRQLYQATWDAAELMQRHPPRFGNRSKAAAFEHLMAAGGAPAGSVGASRWATGGLPQDRKPAVAVRMEPGFFRYDDRAGGLEWHVNFAAHDLFCAYTTSLLAQDELQVLEHPALASVRQALQAGGQSTLVVEDGRPTPILVHGVERRGRLDTAPSPARPHGLYGNNFAASPITQMLEALAPIVPPTISHIIAIEAPPGGSGRYAFDEIAFILDTATTGFRAAVLESGRLAPGKRVVVHTGWWGCGAYGGNRELMGVLQLEAAALAGLDELVFHAGDATGERDFGAVVEAHRALRGIEGTTEVIEHLVARGYRWGVSNGT